MPADKPALSREEIALLMERAGLAGGPDWIETLEKAYPEIAEAARRVRIGIERNDEPASAFHPPREREPRS